MEFMSVVIEMMVMLIVVTVRKVMNNSAAKFILWEPFTLSLF